MVIFTAIFATVFYLHCISVYCHGNIVDDYYWRDYHGVTPPDALKAGKDRNGRPIYVGQVLYGDKLIPGKIHENVNEIHVEFGDVHVLNRAVKILCTPDPEIFEWVQTRHDNVLDKRNDHIIFEGGYEAGYATYVGRAVSHGELTVGKVICHGSGCFKLTTIENGKWYEHDIYEILTYNANTRIQRTIAIRLPTTPSTAATFHEEVYRRKFLTTIISSSKALEKQFSTVAANATELVTTLSDQTVYLNDHPIPVAYSSGINRTASFIVYVLLSMIYCYQLYKER